VEPLLQKESGSASFGVKVLPSLTGVNPSFMNSVTVSACRAKCSNILHDRFNNNDSAEERANENEIRRNWRSNPPKELKAAIKGQDWPILKPRIVEYLLALINVKLEMVLNQCVKCKKSLIAKDKTLKMKKYILIKDKILQVYCKQPCKDKTDSFEC